MVNNETVCVRVYMYYSVYIYLKYVTYYIYIYHMLEKETAIYSSILAWEISWTA